jgi:sister chromatid cohesion protein PDS5
MLDVLCPLITESDVVSNELLNVILINLVEPNKREHKHAYALAKELIIKTNETLEPYIQGVSIPSSVFLVDTFLSSSAN